MAAERIFVHDQVRLYRLVHDLVADTIQGGRSRPRFRRVVEKGASSDPAGPCFPNGLLPCRRNDPIRARNHRSLPARPDRCRSLRSSFPTAGCSSAP